MDIQTRSRLLYINGKGIKKSKQGLNMDKNKITLSFLTRKSLHMLLILFILLCLIGTAQRAHSDPPPPPPDPVTIDPNPFDNWERTAEPPAPPPDPGTTIIEYFLFNNLLRRISIYDLAGDLVRDLVNPASKTTPNKLAGGNSDIWDGKDDGGARVAYGTYPYHVDDIRFIGATTDTGRDVYDVVVDPTDDQKLWITDYSGSVYGLYQSTDGGVNWTDITTSLYSSTGPHLGIAISSDGQRIFVLDKGSQGVAPLLLSFRVSSQ